MLGFHFSFLQQNKHAGLRRITQGIEPIKWRTSEICSKIVQCCKSIIIIVLRFVRRPKDVAINIINMFSVMFSLFQRKVEATLNSPTLPIFPTLFTYQTLRRFQKLTLPNII